MDFTYQPVERYRAIMALLFSVLFEMIVFFFLTKQFTVNEFRSVCFRFEAFAHINLNGVEMMISSLIG